VIALAALGAAAIAVATSKPDPLLADWALARCLARAATGQPFAADAARSASALLQRGTADADAYARIDRRVTAALARPRSGSTGGSYATLTCIELAQAVAKETAQRR